MKDLMENTGVDKEDEEEVEVKESSEVAGDRGGDKEHSLEVE